MGEHRRRKDNVKVHGKLRCDGWCVAKLVALMRIDKPPFSVVVCTFLFRTEIGTSRSATAVRPTLNTTMMSISPTPNFACVRVSSSQSSTQLTFKSY